MTLRQMREKAKLSLLEASKSLNIAYDYLCMIENNRRKPSILLMDKMAKLYKVSPQKIFLAVHRTLSFES